MNIAKFFSRGAAFLVGVSTLAAAGDPRLADAAKRGDKVQVQSLLAAHVDVNSRLGDGATALAWAVHKDDLQMVDLLVRAGADVNAADNYGVTPLHLACMRGNPGAVEKLLQAGANPNAARPTGETVLMAASRTGNVDVVKLLLARSANVNAAENKRGQTALMWALAENHPDVARELVARGADVQARTKGGFTVLMFAAQQGNVDTARMLVAAGAKVNDSTPEDGTALVVASASGHEAFATFLLDKDANPSAANQDGLTAMHYAILRGLALGRGVEWYPGNTYLFRPNLPGLVKALLAHGANPNARITRAPALPGNRRLPGITVAGATPYILAAASYDAELMRMLVAGGADPNVMTAEHSTALFFAAGLAEGIGYLPLRTEQDDSKALEAVKVAVELGNDVNHSNNEHQTPLHGAAYVGSDAIVQYLVDKGANVNVKDNSGQTPLSIARCEFPPTLLEDNLRPQFIHESTGNLLVKLGAIPLPPSIPTTLPPASRQ